jgi:acyl carrier protein
MTPPNENEVRLFLIEHFADAIAAKRVSFEDIGDDFDLLREGIVDSLGVIEMISAVEERFGVTVDFEMMGTTGLTLIGPFSRFVAQNAVPSGCSP